MPVSMKKLSASTLTGLALLGAITFGTFTPKAQAQMFRLAPSMANQTINPNFRMVMGSYPVLNPYAMNVTGFGGSMMSAGFYNGQNMATPYSGSTGYSGSSSQHENLDTNHPGISYPIVRPSQGVSDPRLIYPNPSSSLVSSSPPVHLSTTKDIWLYDDFFSPAAVMVSPGTTVRWINYGYQSHSVSSSEGLWDSGPIRRGGEFSLTFTRPGTYQYFCRYHPMEMQATVIVTR